MRRLPLLLLLLAALIMGCTPRGGRSRGSNTGDDDDASNDDDDAGDDDAGDDDTGDDDTGDDDDSQAGYDGDYYGQLDLSVSLEGGDPVVLCTSDLWLGVQSGSLEGETLCNFGALIVVSMDGTVSGQGVISGTTTVDISSAGGAVEETALTGSISSGVATVAWELVADGGDGQTLPMFGEGTATLD